MNGKVRRGKKKKLRYERRLSNKGYRKCMQMLVITLHLQNGYTSICSQCNIKSLFHNANIFQGSIEQETLIFFQLFFAEYMFLHINHTRCTHTYFFIYLTFMEIEIVFCGEKLFEKIDALLHSSDYYATAAFKIH